MTRINFLLSKKFSKKVFLVWIISILISISAFAEETWTIAAQKFTYAKGQKQSVVTDATAVMFSARILEKLNVSLYRTIPVDENLERLRFTSRKERSSLFLQLSSAIQKRDAVVLQNYSDKELKKKIAEEDKAIAEIREKIAQNIKTLEEAEQKADPDYVPSDEALDVIGRYVDKVKEFFNPTETAITEEQVNFYKTDVTAVFTPTAEALSAGINSSTYQSEVLSAGIDGLLCGTIVSYGDFISLTVDLYSFPGAKLLGSATEFGSLTDADFIASSIARQLVPVISNSLPVSLNFEIGPAEITKKASLYIDELYYDEIPSQLSIDSGVHRMEFLANGYKSVSTSYYFYGNHSYSIQVNMDPSDDGELYLNLVRPMNGDLFANGIFQNEVKAFENEKGKKVSSTSTIQINGSSILGEFIEEDGNTAFFYIPEKYVEKNNQLSLAIKTFDRSEYIEKRRKSMYRAYSGLVVSVIPLLITSGQKNNTEWEYANIAATGVTISAGAYFVYEFVRYLIAANSVLPATPKLSNNFDFYIAPITITEEAEAEITENPTEAENTETDENIEITEIEKE